MPIVNVAGLRAAAVVMACLLSPLAAASAVCETPLRIAWRNDPASSSSSEQAEHGGPNAGYLALLRERWPLLPRPLPGAAMADGAVPPDTQALLGWPRSQVPAGWVSSPPYLQLPKVIVRRRDAAPLLGVEGLGAGRVASPDPLSLTALLAEQAPAARVLPPAAIEDALALLGSGRADAVVATLGEVEAALRRYYGEPLVIAAPAGIDDAPVLATVPACAGAIAAFEQAMSQLPEGRREALRAAWLPPQPRRPPPPTLWRWLPPMLIPLALALVYAFGARRVQRESERRQMAAQRLYEVTANLPAVVYQVRRSASGHYRFLQIVGDVQALFGISRETALIDHRHLLGAVHPDDRLRLMDAVDAAARAGGPIDASFRTRARHGWRWVRSQGYPQPCEGGDMQWSGYWIDISEMQSRTDALAEARRAAERAALEKSGFLTAMSGQISMPMETLLGGLERLARSDLGARQEGALEAVDDAAQMLRQILDVVLAGPHPQQAPLQLQPIDLPALLRAAQQLLLPAATRHELHLRVELDPRVQAGSLADGLRLRQILFNLIGNALKFTRRGGVDLQLQVLQQYPHGQRLRLQVSDSGVGICPERQQAVFAAYTQADASTSRRFGGSGLGLTICRELAASMGAELCLRSTLGEGTTVWLDLDLNACDPPAEAPPR
ncbi:ATP-binding protein [uncultured Stenotrophomonas sp.]|uniref:ATP-binding protein n=1 Tax=uncultured Stenotrophomonas sp. TaxID=165438 RepID=UPI0031F2FC50